MRIRNPLSSRATAIIEANAEHDTCPDCGRAVEAIDVTDDMLLYVVHEGDDVLDEKCVVVR